MGARDAVIDPVEAYNKYKDDGIDGNDFNGLIHEIENVPSDRLDADRKARILTFIKGFAENASLDDVKATFVSKLF